MWYQFYQYLNYINKINNNKKITNFRKKSLKRHVKNKLNKNPIIYKKFIEASINIIQNKPKG